MIESGGASVRRVTWIAVDSWRALVRQRLVLGLVGTGLLGSLGGRVLRGLDFGGAPQRFLLDLGFAGVGFVGVVLAIVGSAQLAGSDRESGAAALILAKPVWLVEYIVGQWLGVVALVSLFASLGAGLVGVLVHTTPLTIDAWGEIPQPAIARLPWAVACATAALVLKLALIAAGARLLAVVMRGTTTVIMVSAVAVALAYLRAGAQAHYDQAGGLGRCIALALRLLPDLSAFEFSGVVAAGEPVSFGSCVSLAAYTTFYVTIYIGAAAWVAERRGI